MTSCVSSKLLAMVLLWLWCPLEAMRIKRKAKTCNDGKIKCQIGDCVEVRDGSLLDRCWDGHPPVYGSSHRVRRIIEEWEDEFEFMIEGYNCAFPAYSVRPSTDCTQVPACSVTDGSQNSSTFPCACGSATCMGDFRPPMEANGKVCKASTNTCAECHEDKSCPSGKVCSHYMDRWRKMRGLCEECVNNLHCPSGKMCHFGKCMECARDSECPSGKVCSRPNMGSGRGKCVECEKHRDNCPSGMACHQNKCVAACRDTDNGFRNRWGYSCSEYHDLQFPCDGTLDNTNFTAADMCCECGGGFPPTRNDDNW